jgi:cruciform cutting endonuclease 1
MVAHSPASLQALKLHCLRKVLFNIGSRQTGNKTQLSERLSRDLVQSKVPSRCLPRSGFPTKPTKILSIDMGIKNLAYCVLSTTFEPIKTGLEAVENSQVLTVSKWERVNVIDSSNSGSANVEESPFSVQNLAPIAVNLVNNIFLPLQPSIILIEQQRFRSGGSSAVQEWTLRVNMLESMFWASIKSLCLGSDRSSPMLASVTPSRVAPFMVPGLKKVEKKDKIARVQNWLDEDAEKSNVQLVLDREVQDVRDSFLEKKNSSRKASPGPTKLDDLSDCLLQAAAWAAWERKRQQFQLMTIEEIESYNS